MSKSQFSTLNNTEVQLENNPRRPDVNEDFQQALAYLLAYDQPNKIFRFLRTDALGRLAVASNNITAAQINANSVSVVAGTTQLIIPANTNRISYGLISSDGFLYVGTAATPPNNQVWLFPAWSMFTDTEYQGDVYVNNNNALNQFIRFFEVTSNA